ncbi:hypothetical protein K523DRAFT_359010 [Schizophyllum commune Tattone D]|nr:hypothetical protein K523DRAFT_359010 [Schizophyllum commune Tattone D]
MHFMHSSSLIATKRRERAAFVWSLMLPTPAPSRCARKTTKPILESVLVAVALGEKLAICIAC